MQDDMEALLTHGNGAPWVPRRCEEGGEAHIIYIYIYIERERERERETFKTSKMERSSYYNVYHITMCVEGA